MENTVTSKLFGLLSVVVALMLLPAGIRSIEEVTGILGSNITLTFTFNKSYSDYLDNIGLYYGNQTKMDEYKKHSNRSSAFSVNASVSTVFYHMTNLSLQDSRVYYTSLYTRTPCLESNRVHLVVREDNSTSTVSPEPSPTSAAGDRDVSRGMSSALLLLTVLCPLLLLLAVALPAVSCCLLRDKETESHTQDRPLPTVEERVSTMDAACQRESRPSSVVYSVLDFPQRAPSTVLDMSSDATYATISYLPQNNLV